jgi:hypothetical protein
MARRHRGVRQAARLSDRHFYVPENPKYSIFESMKDAVRFVVNYTLEEYRGNLRCKSSFVDYLGRPQPWHPFGCVEGVGWAANAVGGAWELYRFGQFTRDARVKEIALSILRHSLDSGFVNYETGFITPYRDTRNHKLYLNYLRSDEHNLWICPGSAAKVAYQFLLFSDLLSESPSQNPQSDDPAICNLKSTMETIAVRHAKWIEETLEPLANGWFPRRCTPEGKAYPFRHDNLTAPDPMSNCSADGLYIIQLLAGLTERGLADCRDLIHQKVNVFIRNRGFYGSINHDTYDDDENVAHAVAFRVLRMAGRLLKSQRVMEFAYRSALEGLRKFEMAEDRHGVATKGLLYMEKTWNTAYMWENAEAAQAYLEAYGDTRRETYRDRALTILRAAARHRHRRTGFLTEGVDWDNRVGAQHHVGGKKYGPIRYTEPFLNHLHIAEPTLYYLENFADVSFRDPEGVLLLSARNGEPAPGFSLKIRTYLPRGRKSHSVKRRKHAGGHNCAT